MLALLVVFNYVLSDGCSLHAGCYDFASVFIVNN